MSGGGESTRGLASPTLAQLYLEQGHPDRARDTCEAILVRSPFNGFALAMLERLREEPEARLSGGLLRDVQFDGSRHEVAVELSWSVPRELLAPYDDPRVDLVLALSVTRGTGCSLRYTSFRCRELDGTQRIALSSGPASAAISLVLGSARTRGSALAHSAHHRPLRYLAIAPPLSW